jgi:hypothetical protein
LDESEIYDKIILKKGGGGVGSLEKYYVMSDWIHLAQDREQCRALLSTEMNVQTA